MKCPKCNFENPETNQFCGKCGQLLASPPETEKDEAVIGGERKQVTVIFSDLSGYTSLSEKLDPEEVHNIMKRIFGEATRIVAKYDGHIDKFIGDAVMVLFGIPKVHEDDPVRAIKAVQEIHDFVDSLSPELEPELGRAIAMHSGISARGW
jgi:class 3 adenylate cyclase